MMSFYNFMFDMIIQFSNNILMPAMFLFCVGGIAIRYLAHWTIKREEWFTFEFQKRAHQYIQKHSGEDRKKSFFLVNKYLLEKTYYELFVMRSVMKRRNPDAVMALADRVFLIQQGCARIVKDSLRQIKYFRYDIHRPKTIEVTKIIFQNNPCFNKLFGLISIDGIVQATALLPGMFIIGGIFGTFIGIMEGLPTLSQLDVADAIASKKIMDDFLISITFSMRTSIVGIIFSVAMTIANAFFNPYKSFINSVEKFENTMDIIWNICDNNLLPHEIEDFDENRDSMEVLAEDSVEKECPDLDAVVAEATPQELQVRTRKQNVPPKFPDIPKAS